jgi:hypothetical protein
MAKLNPNSPFAAAWAEMDRIAQAERAARGFNRPKKPPKHIDDPVFGHLTRSVVDLYERDYSLKLFGKKHVVKLQVNVCPEDGLEKKQIRAFQLFEQQLARMLAEAEKKMLAYYQSVCADYRNDLGITAARDKRVPLIKTVAELAHLVKPEAILFRFGRLRPTFGLLCQCTWEIEHGLAVKFVNGKVAEVGFQDIVL